MADADDVAVGERLAGDPPAVDQGAVGRAEVLGDRRPAVQDDVDVLAAHPRVGQPDVGVGAAADHVAPRRQLVPRAGAVDQQDVGDAGLGAGAADHRGGGLPAGVGGHAVLQRGQRGDGAAAGADRVVEAGARLRRRVGDVRADLEDTGGQLVVALQPDLHGVEDLVALPLNVLGDHVGELGGQLIGPLGEVLVVGPAQPDVVDVGRQDAALAHDRALLVGLAGEGLGDLGRVDLALEDPGERQPHHALEPSLEALQHTHSRSSAVETSPAHSGSP